MARKTERIVKEAKCTAVVARIQEIGDRLEVLAGMWDERTLDTLILALGIGHVELDD